MINPSPAQHTGHDYSEDDHYETHDEQHVDPDVT